MDRGLEVPDASGLDLERFEAGELVLYVLAPRDTEWRLDLFDAVEQASPTARLEYGRDDG